jgi:peptidoglycan/LPS O-acetylase OafA/YrhL
VHSRIPALDGLRGVAILLVVAIHVRLPPAELPLDHLVAFVLSAGWLGVDLFFVLSGFLITGLLIDARGGPRYFRTFYTRRTLRIFPLYYLTLAFVFFIAPRLPGLLRSDGLQGREWWYWLYLSNIYFALGDWPSNSFNGVWSLAVEEQFYLVWPWVVLLCPPRALLRVCVLTMLMAPLVRLVLLVSGAGLTATYALTPARMDALAAGATVSVLARRPGALERLTPVARLVGIATLLLILVIALHHREVSLDTPVSATLGYSLAAVGFGAVLLLTLTSRGALSAVLNQPVLRAFGVYSYAIYLFHDAVWELVEPRLWTAGEPPAIIGSHLPAQLLGLVIMLPLSFATGWLSWNLLERHILALKRFFPYVRRREPDTQTGDTVQHPPAMEPMAPAPLGRPTQSSRADG